MSDLDDFRITYFEECSELLLDLEEQFAAIESGDHNSERLNAVFRAVHSIKGGGGALLREKIVASASERMIVIADHTKRVDVLGRFALPVEVIPFGLSSTRNMVESLAGDCGCEGDIKLRLGPDGKPFVTDNSNYILDCAFGEIEDPEALDDALKLIPGVVENGLFLGIADMAIIAGPLGVEVLASDEDDIEIEV